MFFRMFGVCVCVKYQRWLVGDQGLTREVSEQLRFKKQRHQEVGTKKRMERNFQAAHRSKVIGLLNHFQNEGWEP